MKLDTDLYAYIWKSSNENNCNSFMIGGEMPVIIDPATSTWSRNLIKLMEKDDNRFEDVRLIIATHGHPDHLEAIQTFARGASRWPSTRKNGNSCRKSEASSTGPWEWKCRSSKVSFFLKEGELKAGLPKLSR